MLELITGLYTVFLALYPQPIWYLFILGIVPLTSFAINIYNKSLGKRIKGGIETVLVSIAAAYAYVLYNIISNTNVSNTPSIVGILAIGLIITLLTFIMRLTE